MLQKILPIILLLATPIFAQDSRPASEDPPGSGVSAIWSGGSGGYYLEFSPDPLVDELEGGDSVEDDFVEKDFITLKGGLNLTTQYFARGMLQENQGVISQPWIELQMHLYQDPSVLSDVYLFVRSWNSFHSGPSGTGDLTKSQSPASWFETQFTFGLGIQAFQVFTISGGYNVQISPNRRFDTVEELYLRGDIADKRLWDLKGGLGGLKWEFDGARVYGFFAWETDGQRDGGDNRGVYAEVGANPGITLRPCDDFTFSLSVPFSVGFNVFEYQEVPFKGDAPFGFFKLGAEGAIPLQWISSKYGQWSLYGGVHWYNLGQNASRFNKRHNDEVVTAGGLRFNY